MRGKLKYELEEARSVRLEIGIKINLYYDDWELEILFIIYYLSLYSIKELTIMALIHIASVYTTAYRKSAKITTKIIITKLFKTLNA